MPIALSSLQRHSRVSKGLGEKFLWFFHLRIAMGKTFTSSDAKKKARKVVKKLPFQPNPRETRPRDTKNQQLRWLISGLRHLKVPIAASLKQELLFSCQTIE